MLSRTKSLLKGISSTSIRVERMSLEQRLAARGRPKKEIITITDTAKHKLLETLGQEHQNLLENAIKNANSSDAFAKGEQLQNLSRVGIALSKSELDRIRDSCTFLRLSIKTKGCNGQSYDLSVVAKADKKMNELSVSLEPLADVGPEATIQGFNSPAAFTSSSRNSNSIYQELLIDPKAELFVAGSIMDYEEARLASGFVFKNPQVDGVCGCGESFNFNLDLK